MSERKGSVLSDSKPTTLTYNLITAAQVYPVLRKFHVETHIENTDISSVDNDSSVFVKCFFFLS